MSDRNQCKPECKVPSEFYQIEQNITEINNHPPYPGSDGYWMIWNPGTHEYEQSDKPIPEGELPSIDESTSGKYLTNDGEKSYWAEVQGGGGEGKIDSIEVNGVEQPIVNKTVNIAVPTKVDQLENDAGYITADEIPVKSVNGQTGDVKLDIPEQYELPVATADTLGGVKPDVKTDDMTTPIGVDANGKLWVHVEAGGTIDIISADKVMFDGDMVFTEQFGKYEPTGGKVTIPSNGKSLKGLLLDAYSEDKNPVITQPTVGITSTTAKAYEVGTTVTPAYSGTFNAGTYEYGPNPTGVTVTEWDVSNNVTSETKDTQTGSFAQYSVADGANYRITVKAVYSDGEIPLTALSAEYETGQITASSKTAQSAAITGYRNSFYGTLADKSTEVTNAVVRGLRQKSGKALANGNTFTVNIPVGAESAIIAYPATLRDLTSIKDVNGLNADITSAFTKSTMDITGTNDYSAISYKVYRIDFAKPNDTANKYNVTI